MKTEARGREAESSTQQPAGKQETTAAAAKATATVMAMRNASLPLSQDLATTITTTTVNDYAAGDASAGARGSWCLNRNMTMGAYMRPP